MTIYAKIITLTAVLVSLAVGAQAQTPEIDAVRARAEQGDAAPQFLLATGYAAGRGVPQDYAEAVRWFRLPAEQGYASVSYPPPCSSSPRASHAILCADD